MTFADERASRRYVLKKIKGSSDRERDLKEPEASRKPSFRWQPPAGTSEPLNIAELNEAVGSLVRTGNQNPPTKLSVLGLSDFPLCGAKDLRARLSISVPAYAGELAFVDTAYGCGALCGQGMSYAFRRTGVRWKLVAFVPTWVS